MNKISLLQRQQAFQRDAINNEHEQVKNCKNQIKWLKGVPDISCTQKRIDVLYRCIEGGRKRIAKLAEMQVFTKRELQGAYNCTERDHWENLDTWQGIESPAEKCWWASDSSDNGKTWSAPKKVSYRAETQHKSYNFKHVPWFPFMAEAPAAEVGSLIGEEM